MNEYPNQVTHGTGVTLTKVPDIGVASLAADVTAGAEGIDALTSAGLVPVSDEELTTDSLGGHTRINDGGGRRWVRIPAPDGAPRATTDVEAQLGDQVDWLAPAYQFPDVEGMGGTVVLVPDVLLVRPADGASEDAVRGRLAELGLEPDDERSRYTDPFRYCRVTAPKDRNAIELREALLDDGLFTDARFETMPMLVPVSGVPNDPLYPQQWGMAQIDGPGAWDLGQGGADAVVCILDEGCDLTHPDLSFSDPGINLGTMQPDGSPTGNHGTACAGIAAATTGNGVGVAGVAGRSPILPLAFQNWTDVECAAGIRYAAQHGADVISMSFGVYGPGEGMGPVGWDFAIIDPAIAEAHTAGLVLCAATGNENIDTFNRYPSRHPLVIACGASDQADNRKSETSPDGEDWWGSNYAPGVSVVAPGVRIPTTDRQGTAGYNPQPGTAGDYVATFNGTSSATPHVAGIAALIKAHEPGLSNVEIRRRIETTADKVGTVPYAQQAGFPNGTRNDQMGYGRVNARRALQEGAVPREYGMPYTADLTGDGRADIVGFGDQGVWVSFSNGDGTFQAPKMVVANFAYNAGGWRVEKHPRFLADLTGDGRADIVGFGDQGVWVSLNNGNGTFQPPTKVLGNFAYSAGGWRVEKHPRFLADLTGDGRADIIGFGDQGVWVSLNNGNGTFRPPKMVLGNFAYTAGGWRVEKHPRFVVDLTGDGRADIIGFGDQGVWVSLNNGNGTFQPPKMVLGNFAYSAGGWRVEKHPRFLANVAGGKAPDIVGFGDQGVWVSVNNGDGTFQAPKKVIDNFAYSAGGWRVEKHPRFVADVAGGTYADIVGFGDQGVWVSVNNGDGTFQAPTKVLSNFGYTAGGWRVEKHPRFVADVAGNQRADILGFGYAGVWASLSNGGGTFDPPKKVLDNFGYDAGGWRVERHPRFVAGPR
ncbi:S8 family serine peptidase [Agromyces aurantiacus]|uniref:S8 family serine peptidase n=1 Tax=Agromyces aurantiacus TaxID=165814 RepID=A0ABV9R7H2_9MICO|nr:S8 family serine peptidase [Agromyces aurantiacus]MBM7505170.1 hypothetical protein [Agromyces aurantiacus]